MKEFAHLGARRGIHVMPHLVRYVADVIGVPYAQVPRYLARYGWGTSIAMPRGDAL